MVTRKIAIKTAQAFINDCNEAGLYFYKVLLFGSVAAGNIHEWSDIDLLLISDKFNENLFDNLKLYSKINIKYPSIETHPYPTKHYLQKDEFIERIRKHSIEIV